MAASNPNAGQPFRFFDNREKYLLFVTTCNEKSVIAGRVGMELDLLTPSLPGFRFFDAGMGDGTVLMRVMRDLHHRFPTVPFLVVGKEISLEDTRLSLEKMPDRFFEHPLTVLVVTNLLYREAPWLRTGDPETTASMNWWDVPLEGNTAHEFDQQIRSLQPMLNEGWQTRASATTGNPLPVKPSVMVLYRADQRFVLDPIIPRPGGIDAAYDLILASQPYRARLPADKKVNYVLGALSPGLGPGGRMLVIQSTGHDPGMEIIHKLWPDDDPFWTPRHDLVEALVEMLKDSHPDLSVDAYPDERSLFTFRLHALPDEVSTNIGTSTLLAAWNAAVYVAQIDDARLHEILNSSTYLDATRETLRRHGGLWFLDESFVVVREK